MLDGTEEKWTEFHRSALSFSDELNSVQFYNGLYNIKKSNEYNEYCNLLKPSSRSNAVKSICIRLLNYLKTNDFSNKEKAQYNVCTLLNYWAYDSLNLALYSNKINALKNSININVKFGEIVQIWNRFIDEKVRKPDHETCRPISNIVAYSDWEKRKELYEYYVDYYPIYKYLPSSSEDRCKEFYRYVESKKHLYEHFKERCTSSNEDICPKFYSDCIKYNPEDVLPTFKCHKQITDERAAAAAKASQKRDTYPSSETESRGRSVGMDSVGASQNSSGKSQTVENLGNVLLGVVITSMTSGALYRFTPLGGMIRNGLGWNTNNMRNFNGGDIRLYDYASESFNPYPGEEHYIGYHPA